MQIGKLTEVDVHELWKHEQYDFSNWLAKDENIENLNDILGLTLVDVNKEVFVGAYRCDLVARDETSEIKVIIENQLEKSNHDHLGKIITYASGLNANVVVWIVTKAREEHRSAIEWLNNNTGENLNFFLIELHAYKIGDSLPAPKFEVVEKPNGFIKTANSPGGSADVNRSQAARLEFWERFNEKIVERGKPFNVRKAGTDHWYDVSVGMSGVHIAINLVNKDGNIVVELYINDNKNLFDRLYQNKRQIEQDLNLTLDWRRLDNKKASRIMYAIPGLNFDDRSNYDALMDEVIEKVTLMREVFKKYI